MRTRVIREMAICGFVFVAATVLRGQLLYPDPGTRPSFEVATVKQGHGAGQLYDLRLQPDRFLAENAPLDRLIRFAYDVKSDSQVANMPNWAGSVSFDIDAKIGDDEVEAMKSLPPDQRFQQYRLMVQSLLANRFEMRVRTETKELPVYALVAAKNGPRLTPSAPPPGMQKLPMPQLIFHASGDLKASFVSMAFFIGWLSGKQDTGGRIVIDETGLTGMYDFTLKWTPVESAASAMGGAATNEAAANAPGIDQGGPSLLTALTEQLGLKLEPQKALVQVLVIDHVGQPSQN